MNAAEAIKERFREAVQGNEDWEWGFEAEVRWEDGKVASVYGPDLEEVLEHLLGPKRRWWQIRKKPYVLVLQTADSILCRTAARLVANATYHSIRLAPREVYESTGGKLSKATNRVPPWWMMQKPEEGAGSDADKLDS